jgi:GIY-YIG catalytic domain
MNGEEYEDEIYSENRIEDESEEENETVKKEDMVGSLKVYCIYMRETNAVVYVGRTKRSLNTRFREHQLSSQYVNSYIMNNGGFDKYGIEVLKECETMIDLIEWESHLILEMDPVCNIYGKYKEKLEKPVNNRVVKKNWALISAIKKKYKKSRV